MCTGCEYKLPQLLAEVPLPGLHLQNGGYSQGYARISNAFVNQEERSGQAVKEDSEGKGLPKHENVYSDYELVIARFNEDISW